MELRTAILPAGAGRPKTLRVPARPGTPATAPDPAPAWARWPGVPSRTQLPVPRCRARRGDAESLLWEAPAAEVVRAAYGQAACASPEALIDVRLDLRGFPLAWWQYQRHASRPLHWPYEVPHGAWYAGEGPTRAGPGPAWPWALGAERLLDRLAARAGRDPIDYRLALLAPGALEARALHALAARLAAQALPAGGVAVLRAGRLAVAAAALRGGATGGETGLEWTACEAGRGALPDAHHALVAWTAAVARLNADEPAPR